MPVSPRPDIEDGRPIEMGAPKRDLSLVNFEGADRRRLDPENAEPETIEASNTHDLIDHGRAMNWTTANDECRRPGNTPACCQIGD